MSPPRSDVLRGAVSVLVRFLQFVLAALEREGAPVSRKSIFSKKDKTMNLLWAVAVVLFVMWLLGFAAFHVASGFIHILLILAVVAVVARLVSGPRTI